MNSLELRSRIAPAALARALSDGRCDTVAAESEDARITVRWDPVDTPCLVESIAAFLISDWLHAFIERRTKSEYPFLDHDEREYIALLTLHAVRHEQDPDGRRSDGRRPDGRRPDGRHLDVRDPDGRHLDEQDPDGPTPDEWDTDRRGLLRRLTRTLEEAVCDACRRQVPLSLDAFVQFRWRESIRKVEDAMDTMVDQFLSDREYEEFVSMLRYMLHEQPLCDQEMHVFCSDERVWICDAEGQLVRDREVASAVETASEGEEVNAEDLAMSILITRSPRKIVIHDIALAAPWPSFAETVERVFLERAERCHNCSTCRKLSAATGGPHLHGPGDTADSRATRTHTWPH